MLFDNNNVDLDFALLNLSGKSSMPMNGMNMSSKMFDKSNPNILPAKEGFLRGNMFKNEYMPYKNLTYIDIKPRSDREAMALFEEFVREEKEAKKDYMESYGPLTVTKAKGSKFTWIDNPWPWEDLGGNIYV